MLLDQYSEASHPNQSKQLEPCSLCLGPLTTTVFVLFSFASFNLRICELMQLDLTPSVELEEVVTIRVAVFGTLYG